MSKDFILCILQNTPLLTGARIHELPGLLASITACTGELTEILKCIQCVPVACQYPKKDKFQNNGKVNRTAYEAISAPDSMPLTHQ